MRITMLRVRKIQKYPRKRQKLTMMVRKRQSYRKVIMCHKRKVLLKNLVMNNKLR